jgi:hypothetical protein
VWASTDVQGLGASVGGETFALKLTLTLRNATAAEMLAGVSGSTPAASLAASIADALAVARGQVAVLNVTDGGPDSTGLPRAQVYLTVTTDRGLIATPRGTVFVDLPAGAQMTVVLHLRRRADLAPTAALQAAVVDAAGVVANTVQRGTGIGCRATVAA